MITQQTAYSIYACHREILCAKELLKTMEEHIRDPDWHQLPKDAFGRARGLQLGVPSGESSHRLYDVPHRLATSVIRAHIAEQERKLVEVNEQARIELNTP